MKIIKRILMITGIIIGVILLLIFISIINHKVQLKKEDKLLVNLGNSVDVNGHSINVYTEGTGGTTLVFMSGGGTSSPIYDFKSLYEELSDIFTIVVIEKAGYGFSEVSDIPRDIDAVLEDTRTALEVSNIHGPFILVPHSMSGIEALYWGQKYPNEVAGIVGLDMAVPSAYEDYKINLPLIKLGAFGSNTGLTRFIPKVADSDAIKYGTLSEEEKEQCRMIFYRRTATKTMLNEVQEIKKSASKVQEMASPSIPYLLFSSNGSGTGWDENIWRKHQSDFTNSVEQGKLIELDCPHYVHNYEYKVIAREIKEFINADCSTLY